MSVAIRFQAGKGSQKAEKAAVKEGPGCGVQGAQECPLQESCSGPGDGRALLLAPASYAIPDGTLGLPAPEPFAPVSFISPGRVSGPFHGDRGLGSWCPLSLKSHVGDRTCNLELKGWP